MMGDKRALGLVLCCLLFLAWPCLASVTACPEEPKPRLDEHRILYRAHRLIDAGQQEEANSLLLAKTKQRTDPHHHLYFLLGVIAYKKGQKTQARIYLNRAIQRFECFVPALRNLAVLDFEQGKPLAAAERMQQALRAEPNASDDLRFQAAQFFLAGKRPDRALVFLQELVSRSCPKPAWIKTMAHCLQILRRWEKAEPVIHRLIRENPDSAEGWRLLSNNHLGRKQVAKAAAILEVALRIDPPEEGASYRRLGDLFRAASVNLKAVEYYKKAMGPKLGGDGCRCSPSGSQRRTEDQTQPGTFCR
jgi:tetratricopeptide (TPR) repeat protein